jgi:hypothetical protein
MDKTHLGMLGLSSDDKGDAPGVVGQVRTMILLERSQWEGGGQ